MDMRFISFKVLQACIKKRSRTLADRKKTNAQALALVDQWIQKNFQEEGTRSAGGKWKPLAASTIKQRKRNKKGSVKILQDTGTMRSRWKHLFTPTTAVIQSGVYYSMFHDKGTKRMPQRKITPTKEQIKPIIKDLFDKFIRRALAA